ncbi:MAG: fruK [Microbacteriaceae bacterium]|jgi:1-phosphofructokinase|nr:fruK [Microbacteriaceae bacterium]
MIVTLTVNPSIDRTIELSGALARGEVQRAAAAHREPGGKGINVTRALAASGLDTVALFPAADGDPFVEAMRESRLPFRNVPIAGAVRSNVALTEPDGTTTKVNEPGPGMSSGELDALTATVVAAVADAEWLVISGSLPPSIDQGYYVRVVEAVVGAYGDAAPRIAVDGSGEPLRLLLESDERIDLIKPNAEELAELTGRGSGESFEAEPRLAASAALDLLGRGVSAALVTLGGRGAALVTTDATWFAEAPHIEARSTVGAGDSSLAGYLLASAEGRTEAECLAQAVAHGAAAAALPGSTVPTRLEADCYSITVQRDPGREARAAHTKETDHA